MIRIFKILSCIALAFSLLHSSHFNYPLWIISFFYTIFLFLWDSKKESFLDSPGITVLAFGMFMRYSVLPLSYYIFGGYNLFCPGHYFNYAILLMIYEQIVLFFIIIKTSNDKRSQINDKVINPPSKVSYFICLVALAFSFGSTSIKMGYSTFETGNLNNFYEMETATQSTSSQLLLMIWVSFFFAFYISLLNQEKYLYQRNTNKSYLVYSIILTFALGFLTFINQVGGHIARWQTIVFTISGLFFTMKLFRNNRGFIVTSIGVPLLILVLITTAVKNGGYMAATGGTFFDALNTAFGPVELDAYLNGPDGVSCAIRLKESSSLDISSLFHDIIYSVPILNSSANLNFLTAKQYNLSIGKLGYIIPLSGQSAIYFGYILFPLLSSLAVLFCRKLDNKFRSSNSYYSYIYAFMSIWVSMGTVFTNLTIVNSWIVGYILPLILVMFFLTFLNRSFVRN